jgi:hypothetical protein
MRWGNHHDLKVGKDLEEGVLLLVALCKKRTSQQLILLRLL